MSLQLDDVPLETAVRLLAENAGLKPVRIGNVVLVTTKAHATELRNEPELVPRRVPRRAGRRGAPGRRGAAGCRPRRAGPARDAGPAASGEAGEPAGPRGRFVTRPAQVHPYHAFVFALAYTAPSE